MYHRADSRLAPSQWKTSLQSNTVSHWLGPNLESALHQSSVRPLPFHKNTKAEIFSRWPSESLSRDMIDNMIPGSEKFCNLPCRRMLVFMAVLWLLASIDHSVGHRRVWPKNSKNKRSRQVVKHIVVVYHMITKLRKRYPADTTAAVMVYSFI